MEPFLPINGFGRQVGDRVGALQKPEFAARFELGGSSVTWQTDFSSLLLGRRPMMLGTNPVGYILSINTVFFFPISPGGDVMHEGHYNSFYFPF